MRAWSKKNKQFMLPDMFGVNGEGKLVLMAFTSVFESPVREKDGLFEATEEELEDTVLSRFVDMKDGEEVWEEIRLTK